MDSPAAADWGVTGVTAHEREQAEATIEDLQRELDEVDARLGPLQERRVRLVTAMQRCLVMTALRTIEPHAAASKALAGRDR